MTNYVTKDGRHVFVGASADRVIPDEIPSAELLRNLWREDVSDFEWDQWDEVREIHVHPWKRGRRGTLLFHRKTDDTYWGVDFVSENDGEYHSFRDDDIRHETVYRLWPVQRIVTEYVAKDPNG